MAPLLIPRTNSILFVLLVLGMLASQAVSSRSSLHEATLRQKHERWMAQHERSYKDDAEKEARFQTFKANVEYIESFNRAGNRSYRMAVNPFTDLTNEEFRATYTAGYIPSAHHDASKAMPFTYEDATDVPTSMDWREKGAVTGIKNQQSCGCCWAFSTVAAVEGITMIKTGQLISLSEQQLVDCSTAGVNRGCGGGNVDEAFNYIVQNNGISSEESYPYQATEGNCNAQSAAATITSFAQVPSNSEDSLMKAVAKQPVSIYIDGSSIQRYGTGVFDGECTTNLNHVVTIVGYGTAEDGRAYWLMKNSWGEQWGENGYLRLKRGSEDPRGLCGIAMNPTYPTL